MNNHTNLDHPGNLTDLKKSPMMLINEVARLMGEKIRQKFDDTPTIPKSGRLLLIELAKKDGRTQLDLANTTHLKAPTISVALQKLEKSGFVMRCTDEYDLRATRVYLTEKGRSLDNEIRRRIADEESIVATILSPEESDTLVKLLCKIKYNILSESEDI